MGLVPNFELMRINTITQVFLMLKSTYTRPLKISFLASPTMMGGPN